MRTDWHFTPRMPAGVALRDMSAEQQEAARGLLRESLSEAGASKTEAIMALEVVLAGIEGSGLNYRNPDNYAFLISGTPGVYPWGWRVEGHHLSIHVTVSAPDTVAFTPSFIESNPARISHGSRKGERVQQDEYGLALELAQSLTTPQWDIASIQGRTIGRILTGPRDADALGGKTEGLVYGDFSKPQKEVLKNLITAYVDLPNEALSADYKIKVAEGLPQTYFAWAGGRVDGAQFYYRIQGPRLLIEFDNSQGGGNHIHAIWRDPFNNFGQDDLRRHIAADH